jgi:hypothetical protein
VPYLDIAIQAPEPIPVHNPMIAIVSPMLLIVVASNLILNGEGNGSITVLGKRGRYAAASQDDR